MVKFEIFLKVITSNRKEQRVNQVSEVIEKYSSRKQICSLIVLVFRKHLLRIMITCFCSKNASLNGKGKFQHLLLKV